MATPTAPLVGDEISVSTALYIDRGEDDVVGGLARVTKVNLGISAGEEVPFVTVFEHPGRSLNWEYLSTKQDELREKYGDKRAYPDPDMPRYAQNIDSTRNHSSAAEALAYFADCQIATYQYERSLSRVAKSRLARQRSIAEKMIEAASKYGANRMVVAKLIQRMNQ